MSKKKQAPKASMPTGIYDIDRVLGGKGSSGAPDELDQFLRDERKRQVESIKALQAKEIELTVQKRVKDLEKQVGGSTQMGVNPQELAQIAATVSQLPENQQPIAIQALAAFRQTGGDTMGSLGPLLMVSMLQQKPQASMTELVTALKAMNDITKGSQPSMDNMGLMLQVSKMLGEAKDTAYQTQIQLMQKQIEDIKPHDPLEYQKQLIDIAQGLGFKPGTGEANVELEKIKMDHQNMLQKSNQEFQLLIRKMERDDNRMEALIKMFAPAVTSLSGAAATRVANPVTAQQRTPLVCPNCNYSPIWISPDRPVANCPQCSTPVTSQQYASRLQTGPPPPATDEETGAPPPGLPGSPSPPG